MAGLRDRPASELLILMIAGTICCSVLAAGATVAVVRIVHPDLDSALGSAALAFSRVFAFTAHATRWYTDIEFQPDDVLLFGPEPTGLSDEVLSHPRVTECLRIPMVGGRRSLNLANSAAVVSYEAWRQQGFPGAE